jgi:hypothetical protein
MRVLTAIAATLLIGACVHNAGVKPPERVLFIEQTEAPAYRVWWDPATEQFVIRSWSYGHAEEIMRELCEAQGLLCAADPAGVILYVVVYSGRPEVD